MLALSKMVDNPDSGFIIIVKFLLCIKALFAFL